MHSTQTQRADCRECPARRLCLAAGLDEQALEQLSARMVPSPPMLKGTYLFRAGETSRDCFLVRSGSFKTVTGNRRGEEYVIGFHLPGDLLGIAGQGISHHLESAVALETSTVCRLQPKDLPELWRMTGPALLRLVGQTGRRATMDRVNLARSGADARVAGFLSALGGRLQLQGRDPGLLHLPMTRGDLANHLGMALETLSRTLAGMVRTGLISMSRTRVEVLDPDGLAALASHLDR